MDISATAAAQTRSQTTSSTALNQLSDDYTQFITLLTAQIQNQDPLSPMDSTEFVSQLAQLTQVEQAVQSNANLESLNARIASLEGVAGVNMIGREVVFGSNLVELFGFENKTFYQLASDASNVVAKITDSDGNLVRTLTGLSGNSSKDIDLDWDGHNDDGQPMLAGNYRVSIEATDVDGNPIGVSIFRTATVDETLLDSGNLYYGVSGDEILPATGVLAVK